MRWSKVRCVFFMVRRWRKQKPTTHTNEWWTTRHPNGKTNESRSKQYTIFCRKNITWMSQVTSLPFGFAENLSSRNETVKKTTPQNGLTFCMPFWSSKSSEQVLSFKATKRSLTKGKRWINERKRNETYDVTEVKCSLWQPNDCRVLMNISRVFLSVLFLPRRS